ncbi:MAG: hypothetical protein RBU29_13995 [bacterium]|jgi:hypothetical protein|nr:hypothetical protein [bacterium]
MYKVGHYNGVEWAEISNPPIYTYTHFSEDLSRIECTVPQGGAAIVEQLIQYMASPYFLLYVLHSPQGEAQPGRYQSPQLDFDEIHRFMTRFDSFLATDARFDLWIHSPAQNATLVWDRHNILYLYGPLDGIEAKLKQCGYTEGELEIPSPHAHNYWPEWKQDAKEILNWFEWYHTPLHPDDEQ